MPSAAKASTAQPATQVRRVGVVKVGLMNVMGSAGRQAYIIGGSLPTTNAVMRG
jgi:hypothetical protein